MTPRTHSCRPSLLFASTDLPRDAHNSLVVVGAEQITQVSAGEKRKGDLRTILDAKSALESPLSVHTEEAVPVRTRSLVINSLHGAAKGRLVNARRKLPQQG